MNALTDDKASALSEAAVGGHLSVVEFLLRAGAKVHLQDKDGWTAANHLKRYLSKCRGEFTKEEFEKGRELVTEMFEKYKALQKAGVFVPIARKEESTVFKEDHEDEATSKAQVFHDGELVANMAIFLNLNFGFLFQMTTFLSQIPSTLRRSRRVRTLPSYQILLLVRYREGEKTITRTVNL